MTTTSQSELTTSELLGAARKRVMEILPRHLSNKAQTYEEIERERDIVRASVVNPGEHKDYYKPTRDKISGLIVGIDEQGFVAASFSFGAVRLTTQFWVIANPPRLEDRVTNGMRVGKNVVEDDPYAHFLTLEEFVALDDDALDDAVDTLIAYDKKAGIFVNNSSDWLIALGWHQHRAEQLAEQTRALDPK